MERLQQLITTNRPNITQGSVKTYCSLLKTMFYRHHDKTVPIDLEWYRNETVIEEDVKSRKLSTQSTIVASLIALYPMIPKYREMLLKLSAKYQKTVEKQELTERQSANWMDYSEIKKIYDTQYKFIKPILSSIDDISQADFMRLQDFVLLALTSGVWIAPRRSADWTNMKVRNVDKTKDNYINKNKFVFNEYKTKKTYGTQEVAIPKGLMTILTKYSVHNPYEYLFVDYMGQKITNVDITRRLNHILGRNISTSLLRHIYLSNLHANTPKLTDMQQTASDMGHSVKQQLEYVKHPTASPSKLSS